MVVKAKTVSRVPGTQRPGTVVRITLQERPGVAFAYFQDDGRQDAAHACDDKYQYGESADADRRIDVR